MDITKWKSVALRINAYELLKAESAINNRSPGNQMEEIIKSYIEKQAEINDKTTHVYKSELLNGKYLRQI